MNVRMFPRLAWIGLALVGAAACAPDDDVNDARPISWWEGDGLTLLDASQDPDGARFELAAGDLEVGAAAGGTLRIRNTGAGVLEIHARDLPEALSVSLPGPIERNAQAEVVFSLTPREPGAIRHLFDLYTNDPLYSSVRVRVVARAVTSDPDDPDDPIVEDPEDPEDPVDPDPGEDDPVDPEDPSACQAESDEFSVVRKLDVLWVMDNSGSSVIGRPLIASLWTDFVNDAADVDFHVGVTTTGLTPGGQCPGGALGGENGRLFPVDGTSPRIISSAMTPADQDQAWRNNAQVGDCHYDEQPYEAARLALSPPLVDHADDPGTLEPNDGNVGFLRADADLAIVFVTDERDHASDLPGNTWLPADYVDFFQSLKPGRPEAVKLHLVGGDRSGVPRSCQVDDGDRLLVGVDATGGSFFDICTPQADWAAMVQDLSLSVFGHTGATYRLTGAPEDSNGDGVVDERDVEVKVDGVQLAPISPLGDIVWSLDADTNTIRFEPPWVPATSSQVEVGYSTGCPLAD